MSTTVFLCPLTTILQYFTDAGVPLAGGSVYTYQAGTSTPQATYTDSTGTTENANPIALDSAARLPNVMVWQPKGVALKIIIKDSSGNQVGPVFDQISGINDVSSEAETGSFTATLQGPYTSNPSGIINYVINQGLVTLFINNEIVGTATTSNLISIGSIPAAIQPSSNRYITCGGVLSNTTSYNGIAQILSNIYIGLFTVVGSNIEGPGVVAASGLAGLQDGWCITYPL